MITLFLDIYDWFVSLIEGRQYAGLVSVLKIIGWSISVFLAFLIVVLIKKSDATWWIRERLNAPLIVYGPQRTSRKWQRVVERMQKDDEANWKLAVIEADSILGSILKRMALPGDDMGQRLESIQPGQLASLDLVWEAHRLRNFIVHQPGAKVSRQQAEEAVKGYEAALKELEYL